MSAKSEQLGQELEGGDVHDEVCACCGVAEVDDIKLKDCDDGCDLVKYCGDECQKNNREQHEQECKKRKEELRDKQLLTMPDSSYLGECPICCLPLSLDPTKSPFMTCCSKFICNGCDYANKKREIEQRLKQRCAFCREPVPNSKEEGIKNTMKRIKKHADPVAMAHMGKKHHHKGEYDKALPYFTKATELGDPAAYFCLGGMYYQGRGVEKDMKKAIHRLEKAAIGGHPDARYLLANYEMESGETSHHRRQPRMWCFAEMHQRPFCKGDCEQRRICRSPSWLSGCCGCNKKYWEGESGRG
jgi:tetratricopeptide (TPR) repeat protein